MLFNEGNALNLLLFYSTVLRSIKTDRLMKREVAIIVTRITIALSVPELATPQL